MSDTEKYEVKLTIQELRRMSDTGVVDQYWIAETICSLVGMERHINELTKEN